MKIKNIQKFREYWKNKEGFPDFDENFIGSRNKNVNGFYRIVNGTVHDIKADLTPKLQNAQDEQAIYEFLQNAADSNSDDCAIIYDENYFMVINNGNPFTTKDVEAILNSFQGTKADKLQKENCNKIGRYGIGFKLVHRLVGKSDGAKELIEKLSGPVIFSWFNEQHFTDLLAYEETSGVSFDNQIETESCPWLFKIALTCFPAMPMETIKNLNYEDSIIYDKEELSELVSFINKHNEKLRNLNLSKGSLFFLKFGENKHEKLKKSLKNITSGIGYSLNTLKTLGKVVLQNNLVERIPIERIDFIIDPDEDDIEFRKIDPEFPECPIEIIYGYRTDNYSSLKQAPNIYQFFPMSNESHGLSFFIHSTSFAKVTDRTKLDDKGESNIHTLSYLARELKNKLENQLQIENTDIARNIFKSIVFSEISQRQNSELVVNNFLKPLIDYFRSNVPTVSDEFDNSEDVLIKATKLNITPTDFGIDKDWFYWCDENFDDELVTEIKEKLDVKKHNLGKLIENGQSLEINAWMQGISDDEYFIFLKELDKYFPKKNFNEIEFIKCSDDYFYSIDDLKNNDDIIIVFDKIKKIDNILHELNFIISTINISEYPNIKNAISGNIKYLNEIKEAELFENYVKPKTPNNDLSAEQKKDLFLAVKNLYGVGPTNLSDFELFCNIENEIKPLNKLIDSKLNTPDFLSEYLVLDSENIFEEIRKPEFLRSIETIYASIIYPEWSNIINNALTLNFFNVEFFYEKVKYYYQQSIVEVDSLDEEIYIYDGEEFKSHDDIFYHSKFIDYSKYSNLSSAIEILTGYKTPKKTILRYLNEKPFKTSKDILEDHLESGELDVEDSKTIISFSKEIGLSLFEYGYFENYNSVMYFNKDDKIKNYHTKNEKLIDFIEENLSSKLSLLPSELIDFKPDVLRNSDLQQMVLSELEDDINEYIDSLINILTGENFERLIEVSEEIRIEYKEMYSNDDFEYKLFEKIGQKQIEALRNKLIIENDNDEFYLNEAMFSNKVFFDDDNYELELSKVLPESKRFENASIISKISKSLIKAGLSENKVLNIFDVKDVNTSEFYGEILSELLEAENNLIKNEFQFAFILLYNQFIENFDLSKIEAYHINDQKYAINYSLYLNKYSFVSESETLDERYKNLSKLLKLSKRTPAFDANNSECNILTNPYFDDEGVFICPNIKTDQSDNEKRDLLNYFFNYWTQSILNKTAIKDRIWETLAKNKTEDVLGFNPYLTVWKNKLATKDEKCPKWLKKWGKEKSEHISFLSDFGINTENSQIHKLRNSLLYNSLFQERVHFNDDNQNTLLEATFDWIVTNKIEISENGNFELIEKIADELNVNLETVLDEKELEENSVPFDEVFEAEFYTDWADEFGYKISFYDGEMPYVIQYDDYTLREIRKGNIETIHDSAYLNRKYFQTERDLIKINSSEEYISIDAEKELFKYIVGNSNLPANYAELQKENEELKRKLQEALEPSDGLEKGNANKNRQKEQSREAKSKAKEILSNKAGFDCSNWNDNQIPSTIVKGVKYLGEEIVLVIRSAISGRLHLHPNEWVLFDNANTFLVVRVSQEDFIVIGASENIKETLKADNDTISVNFDTDSFGIEGIDSLSKVLSQTYLVGTGYVFNTPGFSYFDKLENLGQNIKNVGQISSKTYDDF